jgi:hypothetical protein
MNHMKTIRNNETTMPWTLLYVGLFALAMGYLESAVVVYLRALYYPDGFLFPMKMLDNQIAITELFREAATIVMLISVGVLASRKPVIRFAFFIYAFAIWDIFYYVFLWLLIGWPSSLLEWDLLFLIPVAWIGPVIAPVINSMTMIALACLIIFSDAQTGKPNLKSFEWGLLIVGSIVTIVSYTIDYTLYLVHFVPASDMLNAGLQYIPMHFNWWLFALGEILFFYALLTYWKRTNLNREKPS